MPKWSYVLLVFLFAACSKTAKLDAFNAEFFRGHYVEASQGLEGTLVKDANGQLSGDDIFPLSLALGTSSLWAKEYDKSITYFDVAIKETQEGRGEYLDGIFATTYEALAFLGKKDFQNVNVSLNRVYSLQQLAVKNNEEEIQKADAKIKESLAKIPGAISNKDLQKKIKELGGESTPLKNFVNPYSTYLLGLNDATTKKDYSKIKRVSEFVPNNTFVKSDVQALQSSNRNVWVIFENGQVGKRKTNAIFVEITKDNKIDLALPFVEPGKRAIPSLTVAANNKEVKTEVLANIDAVLAEYLKTHNQYYLTTTISLGLLKIACIAGTAVATVQTAKNSQYAAWASPLIGVAGTAACDAVTDGIAYGMLKHLTENYWDTLPVEVQLARLETPKDNIITIKEAGIGQITLPKDVKNSVVLIRLPSESAEPSVIVSALGDK